MSKPTIWLTSTNATAATIIDVFAAPQPRPQAHAPVNARAPRATSARRLPGRSQRRTAPVPSTKKITNALSFRAPACCRIPESDDGHACSADECPREPHEEQRYKQRKWPLQPL